jgi:hypothetical protein
MRPWILCAIVALAMAMRAIAHAQQGPYNDKQNPNEYTDTEDGQLLKLVSYVLAPIGYALEWTVTRPMHNLATKTSHNLATKTSLAPALSGDTEYSEMYNPGPNVAPIVPAPPATTASGAQSSGSAPQTYIERTPVGPATVRQPLAPLTSLRSNQRCIEFVSEQSGGCCGQDWAAAFFTRGRERD